MTLFLWTCAVLVWVCAALTVCIICAMGGCMTNEREKLPGPMFATGASLDALAHVLGLTRLRTRGRRLWYTLWLVRGPDVYETDADLRERTRAALGVATGANVDWWGRP